MLLRRQPTAHGVGVEVAAHSLCMLLRRQPTAHGVGVEVAA